MYLKKLLVKTNTANEKMIVQVLRIVTRKRIKKKLDELVK